MNLEPRDPRRELDEFRRRSNEMLDELLLEISTTGDHLPNVDFQPDVDLVETHQEFRFYVSIPGMVEDDLLINIDGSTLTLRGERHPPYDMNRQKSEIREWRYGFFERSFELPCLIEVTSLRAKYDSGVLMVVAQKLLNKAQSSSADSIIPPVNRDNSGGQS